MTQIIDFYFDVGSPASYLAWTQLPALALSDEIECRSWKITFQSAGEQKFERLFGHL
ncbi:hypothetical protein KUV35_14280 [Marinobacter salsuginis]|uniref:hypothetical protein n=1 Tax=Marinobacter salsuginis TaxID=418719 RepID=UPI001C97BFE8|nr:hypothetical protein [Marinobacter salsuginis]MBY6072477.1 hypothetical protein [Marinobacter salsuginis]